ncbi:MAG: hypothetical protein WC551_10085 [Patescibacteria group bacterium]
MLSSQQEIEDIIIAAVRRWIGSAALPLVDRPAALKAIADGKAKVNDLRAKLKELYEAGHPQSELRNVAETEILELLKPVARDLEHDPKGAQSKTEPQMVLKASLFGKSAKWERLVGKLKKKGDVDNPYAVATAALGGKATTDHLPDPMDERKKPEKMILKPWVVKALKGLPAYKAGCGVAKAAPAQVGATHVNKEGIKTRKVAPGKWVKVSEHADKMEHHKGESGKFRQMAEHEEKKGNSKLAEFYRTAAAHHGSMATHYHHLGQGDKETAGQHLSLAQEHEKKLRGMLEGKSESGKFVGKGIWEYGFTGTEDGKSKAVPKENIQEFISAILHKAFTSMSDWDIQRELERILPEHDLEKIDTNSDEGKSIVASMANQILMERARDFWADLVIAANTRDDVKSILPELSVEKIITTWKTNETTEQAFQARVARAIGEIKKSSNKADRVACPR